MSDPGGQNPVANTEPEGKKGYSGKPFSQGRSLAEFGVETTSSEGPNAHA
jgi:hypothetical protein